MEKKRCDWCLGDPLYLEYHDKEWGIPVYDSQLLFEFLILEGMQAGLSWLTILKKREDFRKAFSDFNPEKMARFTSKKIDLLMNNSAIIRNRLKIEATIKNARGFLAIQEKENFSDFIWAFVDGMPKKNHWKSMSDVPALTKDSEKMSKNLKKLGFNFVGPTICYAFMQAVGMVNDHLVSCFRHDHSNV